jgi:hypothetical protein
MLNPSGEKIQQFTVLFLSNGCNAVRACVAMGMKEKTARAHAYLYRRLARLSLADALRAHGLDEIEIAKKLKTLCFGRNKDIALRAIREANKILGAYPAEKSAVDRVTVNVIVDVDL